MKKIMLGMIVVGFLCSISTVFAETEQNILQNQIFQLQNDIKGVNQQFPKVYKQIKAVSDQMPALNQKIQQQVETLQNQNTKALQKVQADIEKQLQQINTSINDLKQRLAKKGI